MDNAMFSRHIFVYLQIFLFKKKKRKRFKNIAMLYVFSMEITYMHVSWSVQPTKLDLKRYERTRENDLFFSMLHSMFWYECFKEYFYIHI